MAHTPTPPATKQAGSKKPTRAAARKPARPKGLAQGRWQGDFPDLSPAEQHLVECCACGKAWVPKGWDGKRPEEATPANTIRAELIRFLVLGGDESHPAHEQGVMVRGAWVAGTLNLHQCHAKLQVDLQRCHIAEVPMFIAAHMPELVLTGSKLAGLDGARIKVNSSVFFDEEFAATGEVHLIGAEIGGDLDCSDGTFTNADGEALNADRITVGGSLFFRTAKIEGAISLVDSQIGTLIDDDACWAAGGHVLDGLQYDRIIGPTDAASRIRWLERQRADQLNEDDWSPQPWEQLVKTLRDMGHPLEATKVAIAKQERMRRAGKVGGPFAQLLHWIYGALAGYGYRPLRTVRAMLVVWVMAAVAFHFGGQAGYVGPTTPLFNSPALSGQVEQHCGHGSETGKTPWTRCAAMPAEYTTFQPLIYSLDLILPLVDLQQEADWAPIVEDPPGRTLPFGAFLRWLMWFEILFGWAMSLMLVAVLGKLVNKD
jgi:hypothetical protein